MTNKISLFQKHIEDNVLTTQHSSGKRFAYIDNHKKFLISTGGNQYTSAELHFLKRAYHMSTTSALAIISYCQSHTCTIKAPTYYKSHP